MKVRYDQKWTDGTIRKVVEGTLRVPEEYTIVLLEAGDGPEVKRVQHPPI